MRVDYRLVVVQHITVASVADRVKRLLDAGTRLRISDASINLTPRFARSLLDVLPNASRLKMDEFRSQLHKPRIKKLFEFHKPWLLWVLLPSRRHGIVSSSHSCGRFLCMCFSAVFSFYAKTDTLESKTGKTSRNMAKAEFLTFCKVSCFVSRPTIADD